MRSQRPVMIDIEDADPADAINAFLHVLNKQRSLGLVPRTEHILAERLLRGDVKIMFYSNSGGTISLVQDEESINSDDAFDMVMFIMERRKKRLLEARERQAASGIEARSDETPQAVQPVGREHVPSGDAQTTDPTPTKGR